MSVITPKPEDLEFDDSFRALNPGKLGEMLLELCREERGESQAPAREADHD